MAGTDQTALHHAPISVISKLHRNIYGNILTMLNHDASLNLKGATPALAAILPRERHTTVMATYTIIPTQDGSGFHVGVVGHDGTRHTMLGFESMEEAEAWIIHDKRFSLSSDELQDNETRA